MFSLSYVPIFTVCFIAFIAILTYQLKSTTAKQDELNEKFWDREREANSTRRKDISNLDYITIPDELFPMNLNSDVENTFAALREKKLLNLTGISNTDLKLTYGVQNLEVLTEYDNNFTEFVRLVPLYAKELIASDQEDLAVKLLEFAVSKNADSKSIYVLLADIYLAKGNVAQINSLVNSASEITSLSQKPILDYLNSILEPTTEGN